MPGEGVTENEDHKPRPSQQPFATFIFLITRIQKIQLLSLDLLKIYNLEVVSLMATIKLESVLSLFIFPNHQLFILGLMVDINFGFLVVILFSVESVYFLILFFSFSTRDLLKFINATNDYFHGGLFFPHLFGLTLIPKIPFSIKSFILFYFLLAFSSSKNNNENMQRLSFKISGAVRPGTLLLFLIFIYLMQHLFLFWKSLLGLVFWNSIHLEVASDSFCFLINSSWLLAFILYVFFMIFSGFNLYCWKGIHFS